MIRCFCDTATMSPVLAKMIDALCIEQSVTVVRMDMLDVMSGVCIHEGDRIILAFDIKGPYPPAWVQHVFENTERSAPSTGFIDVVMGLMIASEDDLHTKSVARTLIESFNRVGIAFPGQCLVEATGELKNLSKWVRNLGKSEAEILDYLCTRLGKKVSDGLPVVKGKQLLVVHASDSRTSNTLAFWERVTDHLASGIKESIKVLDLYEKEINECRGCSFEVCNAYGRQNSCHYKDHITESAYSLIRESDVIVWLCPNYNDNMSAPLVALVNRLTVLYRQMSFEDKRIMSVVVSGNSGGDAVQKQVIGSLNMNKGFAVPALSVVYMTANAPLSIRSSETFDMKAMDFADRINRMLMT